MDVPTCLIITGVPAAGKSTVSALVSQRLARSALLNGDQVSRLVVGGHVWALGDPPEEAARQVWLCNTNLATLAGNFVDAGFTTVIDWILSDREELDTIVQELLPRPVSLVVLDPAADVCRARNRSRAEREQFDFDGYESLRDRMRAGFGDLGWWFDTAHLTPEQTASAILADAGRRGRLPAGQLTDR